MSPGSSGPGGLELPPGVAQAAAKEQFIQQNYFALSAGIYQSLVQQDFARAVRELEEEKSIWKNKEEGPEPKDLRILPRDIAEIAKEYAKVFIQGMV
jgi:hypothetical protein